VTIGRRIPRGMGRLAAGVGGVFEPIAGDALDRSLAGPLPEAFARSLVEHRVVERVVGELFASPEFRASLLAALEHEHAEELASEALSSDAVERLLAEALSSPAVQGALARQTATFGERIIESLRGAASRGDTAVDQAVRHSSRHPWAGICTRGLGLAVDALLAQLLFLTIVGTIALVGALAVGVQHGWLAGTLGAVGWIAVQAAYFGGSWATTARTPGMALVGVRVQCLDGSAPGLARSLVRLVGLWVSIALLGLGFVPALFDSRRRALHDFLAATTVVAAD
jgi:uncharacterized RDD family membrane protein YckC